MRRTLLRSAGLLCTVLVASGTLSSCSGADEGSGSSGTSSSAESAEETPSESATSDSTESAASESSEPDGSASAAEELGRPVATRRTTLDGTKATLQLFPLVRSGSTTVLNFAMTVDPAAEESLALYDLFGDGLPDAGQADSAASVDGVKLVDTKNSKLYLVASDGKGSCVCTNSFSGRSAEPGDVVNMSATFAAVPDDVTSVDVTVPQFGTVNRVPVG